MNRCIHCNKILTSDNKLNGRCWKCDAIYREGYEAGLHFRPQPEYCPQHGYPLPCAKCGYSLLPAKELLTEEWLEHEIDYMAHEIVVPITGKASTPYEENAIAKYKRDLRQFADHILAKQGKTEQEIRESAEKEERYRILNMVTFIAADEKALGECYVMPMAVYKILSGSRPFRPAARCVQ